jgi:hypothetical protein
MPGVSETPYQLVFFEEDDGSEPVVDWMRGELSPGQRRAIGVAMHEILAHEGNNVLSSEFGKPLGQGLSEFRLRHDAEEILSIRNRPFVKKILGRREKILLRVFFHAHGDKLILLLGGYDKGRFPGKQRQQQEIEIARKRLTRWREREKRKAKEARR